MLRVPKFSWAVTIYPLLAVFGLVLLQAVMCRQISSKLEGAIFSGSASPAVTPGESVLIQFSCMNSGEKVIPIRSVVPSCSCVEIVDVPKEIAPHASFTITTRIHANVLMNGISHFTIRCFSNDRENPVVIANGSFVVLQTPNARRL